MADSVSLLYSKAQVASPVSIEAIRFGVDGENLRAEQILREGVEVRLRFDDFKVSHAEGLGLLSAHAPFA